MIQIFFSMCPNKPVLVQLVRVVYIIFIYIFVIVYFLFIRIGQNWSKHGIRPKLDFQTRQGFLSEIIRLGSPLLFWESPSCSPSGNFPLCLLREAERWIPWGGWGTSRMNNTMEVVMLSGSETKEKSHEVGTLFSPHVSYAMGGLM